MLSAAVFCSPDGSFAHLLRAGDAVIHAGNTPARAPAQAVVVEVFPTGLAELNTGQTVAVAELHRCDTDEAWKPVTGFGGRYWVSSHGQVVTTAYRRTDRTRLLKPQRPQAYPFVVLASSSEKTLIGLNRLVAQHFLPPPLAGQAHVVPKDGNPLNVHADNLEWVNRRDVADEAIAAYFFRRGERHHHSRLTTEEVAQVRQLAASGLTQQTLADRFGVSRATISFIVNGQVRRNG